MQKDTFDGSRKDFNAAIDRICEFTGEYCCVWNMSDQAELTTNWYFVLICRNKDCFLGSEGAVH